MTEATPATARTADMWSRVMIVKARQAQLGLLETQRRVTRLRAQAAALREEHEASEAEVLPHGVAVEAAYVQLVGSSRRHLGDALAAVAHDARETELRLAARETENQRAQQGRRSAEKVAAHLRREVATSEARREQRALEDAAATYRYVEALEAGR